VGRPICSYINYIFERASIWLHHQLLPILLGQEHHLVDSLQLLEDISKLKVPANAILFTFDVEALYPSIPTPDGLDALSSMIHGVFSYDKEHLIMSLARLVLKHHYLEFDGAYWKQIRGTAMGSNFVVVYACLFLCDLENKVWATAELDDWIFKPMLYFKRYIDDAFEIWRDSREELEAFLKTYGTYYPSIRITQVVSKEAVDILNVHIFKGPTFGHTHRLSISCHQKVQNKYQYLPWYSWHPLHQKKAFVTGELRRYVLRESTLTGFRHIRRFFYDCLRARGYPASFIRKCFREITYDMKTALLASTAKRKTLGPSSPIVFKVDVSQYTEALDFSSRLNHLLFSLLQDVPELRFLLRPLVCWHNPRNLKKFLCRAKLS
jgi:hypothetical protein